MVYGQFMKHFQTVFKGLMKEQPTYSHKECAGKGINDTNLCPPAW